MDPSEKEFLGHGTDRKQPVISVCVLVTQSCPTLCDPMNCSPPGSFVRGILQARILEQVAISFSKWRLGFLIFPCYCLELCIQMGITFFLLCLQLLFSAICKASSNNHFAFLHFFFLGVVLLIVSCTMSGISNHSSSGTRSIRSDPLPEYQTT